MEFVVNTGSVLAATDEAGFDFLYSDEAVAAVKAAHKKGGKWWFHYGTRIDAPWDHVWKVGDWINNVKSVVPRARRVVGLSSV